MFRDFVLSLLWATREKLSHRRGKGLHIFLIQLGASLAFTLAASRPDFLIRQALGFCQSQTIFFDQQSLPLPLLHPSLHGLEGFIDAWQCGH